MTKAVTGREMRGVRSLSFCLTKYFYLLTTTRTRDTINPCNVIYTHIGITLAILDLRRYLPSQMSADGADNREYRVIRRIQKACTNCR